MKRNHVLVTGGLGYIGSHTVTTLIQKGFSVTIFDDASSSSVTVVNAIGEITGEKPNLVLGSVTDLVALDALFSAYQFDAVVHFAALKSVSESFEIPWRYFEVNVLGSIALAERAVKQGVSKFVFSSSATVYGDSVDLPFTETTPLGAPLNPYGASKMAAELALSTVLSGSNTQGFCLRYFNPIGAHDSELLGESVTASSTNIFPIILASAGNAAKSVSVFGTDYDTPDGTCLRDYIHVMDLAEGHVSVLEKNVVDDGANWHVFNMGTGRPVSVLELISKFTSVNKVTVNFNYAPRRQGDIPMAWADVKKVENILGWRSQRGLHQMVSDGWKYFCRHDSGGYR